ncbi:FAD binding domain-containing protein [Rhizobium rhizogenes]|uniref:FAD binding domain-containing protein n=1 Tax=Rhizobium rhizogenes TaxID=359 RepID=UPI0015724E60|nr:FAD binding domain-containing protein [Rhizobium rhizogenes]NTH23328.1 FAD-binding molybdopterin dehydrogenase [Rhizobium rhizogenes]NTH36350.1 FAD-binding molybdopterin dehydrogenase [Rhizobium rhizogenes]
MDLHTISSVIRPRSETDVPIYLEGDTFLAGGTWLFSEPQRQYKRMVDLTEMRWEPLTVSSAGLSIAATCTVAELRAFDVPADWRIGELIQSCCDAFLASFKIWNMATVGGNICMSLPAGPMISLTGALDGVCVISTRDQHQRKIPIVEFVKGPQSNALLPGEFLRSVEIPVRALYRRTAFRRASLTPLGRSGVLLIGAIAGDNSFILIITAATSRPVRLVFESPPSPSALIASLDQHIPPDLYHDDMHGRPEWRRHVTIEFAEEIRSELFGDDV